MNKKELNKRVLENHKKYKVQGTASYTKPAKNKCVIHAQNTLAHEMSKAEVCYYLLKAKHPYITEAYDKKLMERNDVVDLVTGYKYELETDPRRAKRFEGRKDVVMIPLWKDINIVDYLDV